MVTSQALRDPRKQTKDWRAHQQTVTNISCLLVLQGK